MQRSRSICLAQTVTPIIEAIRRSLVTSLRRIAEAYNDRSVRTARSGRWQVSNLRNLLRRSAAAQGRIAAKNAL